MDSRTVTVPKDIQQMAMAVLGDRKTQGYTPDDLVELRESFREMALADIDDFRRYLEAEMLPILERRKMVMDMVNRIKAKLRESA